MGETNSATRFPYLREAFRQLSKMASVKAEMSELLKHSLEKGLNNEAILREILRKVLPRTYGIGKGKVISPDGIMSRQCDIIIYDALNCPSLFVDENLNQVLPIEGIYAVAEVKTKLTKHELADAFDLISSVKKLVRSPKDFSTNEKIERIPPFGYVISYDDTRSLETIYDNYVSINRQYHPTSSSHSYSKRSTGYAHHTLEHFLIEDVVVMNKGLVYYTYDGFPVMFPSGQDSLGMLISEFLTEFSETKLEIPDILDYYGGVTTFYGAFTKSGNEFFELNVARRRRFPDVFKDSRATKRYLALQSARARSELEELKRKKIV
jgi:hypothetical protein